MLHTINDFVFYIDFNLVVFVFPEKKKATKLKGLQQVDMAYLPGNKAGRKPGGVFTNEAQLKQMINNSKKRTAPGIVAIKNWFLVAAFAIGARPRFGSGSHTWHAERHLSDGVPRLV